MVVNLRERSDLLQIFKKTHSSAQHNNCQVVYDVDFENRKCTIIDCPCITLLKVITQSDTRSDTLFGSMNSIIISKIFEQLSQIISNIYKSYNYNMAYTINNVLITWNYGVISICGTPYRDIHPGDPQSGINKEYFETYTTGSIRHKPPEPESLNNGLIYYTEAKTDIVKITHGNIDSYAVLTDDGKVITCGSDCSEVAEDFVDIVDIISSDRAFAALRSDGSVVTWGDPHHGGDSSNVFDDLEEGVKKIVGTMSSFAALKNTGEVITWGDSNCGGDSSHVKSDLTNIIDIYSSIESFSAVTEDYEIISWGSGSINVEGKYLQIANGITQHISTFDAFAVIDENNHVMSWGDRDSGGNISELIGGSRVIKIASSINFAAITDEGKIIFTEPPDIDEFVIPDAITDRTDFIDIVGLFDYLSSFIALTKDGKVICMGEIDQEEWEKVEDKLSSGVVYIEASKEHHTSGLATAVMNDGSIVSWGRDYQEIYMG